MNNQAKQNELVERLSHAYFFAKRRIINEGYANEIDWQDSINFSSITESVFLREAAWVILASGMSDAIISKKFDAISNAFCNWEIDKIKKQKAKCRTTALHIFNNDKKIDAILFIAKKINDEGFDQIKREIQTSGIEYLITLPFIGPATSYHLAKNIGFSVAKPDRHLVRISEKIGFASPHLLCSAIASRIEEKISVVDLVIWRYATINKNYIYSLSSFIGRLAH
jgi:hypothetical protein